MQTVAGLIIITAVMAVYLRWGGTGLVGLIAGPIVVWGLYRFLRDVSEREKFFREAPGRVQDCMETVKESLAAGERHLEKAEHELESQTAPLFWDAMDEFPVAIEQGRTAWNAAVDIAERYERQSRRNATPLVPDASLPARIVELGGKWLNLRRQSLASEHFASIFEQRRQADKIADHLKKQRERIETAIDAARRAELAASQARAVAEQASTTAKQASTRAGSASRTASGAKSLANDAIAIARWSKI